MLITAPPAPRRGPRPLLLHLTLAMLRSTGSLAGSPNSNSAWRASSTVFSHAAQGVAAALRQTAGQTGQHPPDAAANPDPWADAAQHFIGSPWAQALHQDRALLAGIAAYRRHPWRRTLPDPPCLWQEGDTRLLDYGADAPEDAPAILFVPSLINRAYVLDLSQDHSMLRFLAGQGVRPLLLDWGWPGMLERRFTLTDYIAGRLERALVAAAAHRPVLLAGYCMGGLLAVAAAQRRPDLVHGLALLATPWDFHAGRPETALAARQALALLEPALGFANTLSVDLLQAMFTLLDPFAVAAKYRAFSRVGQNSDRARLFVAMEDWLNDGIPLAAPVARECLGGWYADNLPARGEWQIAGLPVDPASLCLPAFVVVPLRDRIVPPRAARPLARLIQGSTLHEPASGHIGMVAGGSAETQLWRPLLAWLRSLKLSSRRRPI